MDLVVTSIEKAMRDLDCLLDISTTAALHQQTPNGTVSPPLVLQASANGGFLAILFLWIETGQIFYTFKPPCLFHPPSNYLLHTVLSLHPRWPCYGVGSCCLISCMIASLPDAADIFQAWSHGSAQDLKYCAPIYSSNSKILTLPPTHQLLQFQGTPQPPIHFHNSMLLHLLFPPSGIPFSWLFAWCKFSLFL